MAKDKAFYRVTDFSEEFEGFRKAALEGIDDNGVPDKRSRIHLKMLLKQMEIQMIIAQQLTMISQHMGYLREVVQKDRERAKES